MMTNTEFANIAKKIATEHKTLYVLGCFGSPLNEKNKQRYTNNYEYNKLNERTHKIINASSDTFGFDCVCLVKGILWGWNADLTKTYGGAIYKSNNVPDFGADGIINYSNNVSTSFGDIQIGEILHMPGHVGIYIGDGLAVECTPIWKDGVQITAVGNISKKNGYHTRTWVRHGRLNFVDYTSNVDVKKINSELAKEVLEGKWGNGIERKNKLTNAGYDYDAVQTIVNELLNIKKISDDELLLLVKRTIRGDFGNAERRKKILKDNYAEVQRQVNLNLRNGLRNWSNIQLFK